MPVEYVID